MDQPILPVTLALTTLNEEHSIGPFLASVGAQTALPREIVICDGGSSDATAARIQSAAIPGVDIRLVTSPGSNIARGRNAAVRAAREQIVAVSDAGCTLAPDWLERITEDLLRDDEVTVVGGGYGFQCATRFESVAAAAEMAVDRIPDDAFLPSSRSFALRRSVWERSGGYPEELTFAGEDTAFCLTLQRSGYHIRLRRDAVVTWRPRGTLRTYMRQHYLYGIGDGEAGNKGSVYIRIAVKYAAVAIALAACMVLPWVAVLLVLGIALYAFRLYRLYDWRRAPAGVWMPASLLIAVKELTTLTGFLRGCARRGTLRRSLA